MNYRHFLVNYILFHYKNKSKIQQLLCVHKMNGKQNKEISNCNSIVFDRDWQQVNFNCKIIWYICTVWKVSVFGVFLLRIFPYLGWIRTDTPYLSIFSPNAGKYGAEKLQIQTLFTYCWRQVLFIVFISILKMVPVKNNGRLSEYVISHSCLCNKQDKNFKELEIKQRAWQKIALNLEQKKIFKKEKFSRFFFYYCHHYS